MEFPQCRLNLVSIVLMWLQEEEHCGAEHLSESLDVSALLFSQELYLTSDRSPAVPYCLVLLVTPAEVALGPTFLAYW